MRFKPVWLPDLGQHVSEDVQEREVVGVCSATMPLCRYCGMCICTMRVLVFDMGARNFGS